jgi:hypothetical protein
MIARVRSSRKPHVGKVVSWGPGLTLTPFPEAKLLEIVPESEGGVLLIKTDAEEKFAGDDWYASIEDAKKSAEEEYELEPGAWTD